MKIALCCIAKCENLYLSEWVNYHLNLGFDHIYIYDNNDTNGERCEEVIEKDNPNVTVLTTYIGKKQKGCETQIRAYNDFYKTFGKKYDWVLFSDVDEFLVLNKHTNVNDYISSITDKKTKCVKLNWKCYGDNEQLHYENKPVVERFTKECDNKEENRFYKSFYKTKISGFELINVHYSLYVSTIVDCDGNEMKYEKNVKTKTVNTNLAYFAHYVTKSADEYYQIKKKRRSPGVSDNRLTIGHYFKYNTRTKEKEDYLLSLFNESKNPNEIIQNICDYPFGVSVCISAWKTSEYIEECLNSVANQTWFKNHDNYEILLGIDGCKETLEKVREIMHKYKNLKVMMMNKNVGTYVTCNTIMKEARYEWLLRFDSDDVMYPNMVEVLMKKKGNAEFVLCKCNNKKNGDKTFLAEGQIFIGKDCFMRYGGFLNRRCGSDTELRKRTENKIKQLQIQDILLLRRERTNSLTKADKYGHKSKYRDEVKQYIKEKSPHISKIKFVTENYTTIFNNVIYGYIGITSWKKRISTLYKTIDSLLKNNGFKIILTLSEEEFPKKEMELPSIITQYANENKIEILWIYKNYRSFKKILFAMDKYRTLPFITADDDGLYPINYCENLYKAYCSDKTKIYYNSSGLGSGFGYIFPPYIFKQYTLQFIEKLSSKYDNDDLLYIKLADKMNIKRICLNNKNRISFHDQTAPINMAQKYKMDNYKNNEYDYYNSVIIVQNDNI